MQHEQFRIEYEKRKENETNLHHNKYPVVVMGSPFDIVLSNVDTNLRYTFIFNPYHDFNKNDYLGKRDDQIDSSVGSMKLQELKKRVINSGTAEQSIIDFYTPAGIKTCSVSTVPLYDDQGEIIGATSASADITRYTDEVSEKNQTIIDLQQALLRIKTLHGIVPVCSYCKSIKDEHGSWQNLETYLTIHTDAKLSHGICPSCLKSHYPEYYNR